MKKVIAAMTTNLLLSQAVWATPIVNFFELGVQPHAKSYYDEIGQMNISRSIATEPNTLAMYSTKADNANLAYMFEIYQDEAAYQTHLASPQYQIFMQSAPNILTEHKHKVAISPYFLADKKIQPSDKAKATLYTLKINPKANDEFIQKALPIFQNAINNENALAIYAGISDNMDWYIYTIYQNTDKHDTATVDFDLYLNELAYMIDDTKIISMHSKFLSNQGNLYFIKNDVNEYTHHNTRPKN